MQLHDTRRLLKTVGSTIKRNVILPKSTQWIRLEESRVDLYRAVNTFLLEPMP